MKSIFTYAVGFVLICFSSQLLVSCEPWELPTKKTKRNCQKPAGTVTPQVDQLRVSFSITSGTGTVDGVTWDFGDGSTTATTGMTPVSHTYQKAGTYTVKANLANSCDNGTTVQTTVVVSDAVLPTVTLQPVTDALTSTAGARMTITSNGNATITRYGVCYSASSQMPDVDNHSVQSGTVPAVVGTAIPISLTGLAPNTIYYARSFAQNLKGVGYSQAQSFRTGSAPSVNTGSTTAIGISTASVIFYLNNQGSPPAVEYGTLYSTSNTFDANNTLIVTVPSPNTGVNTVVNLTNLTPNTTYYYRSYAKLPNGEIVYGMVQSFTTQIDTVASDLIAHVTFTNRSLSDATGNNNNVILVDSPTFTADRKGNANSAILLDGINDYFYMAENPNGSLLPDAISVSVWIRPNAINNINDRMQIFNKSRWDDSSGEMYSSLVKKNEKGPGLTFMTNIKQNSNCQAANGWRDLEFSNNPPLGEWYHLVLVYSGRTMRMYFNGTPQDQRTDLPATSLDKCAGGELKFGAQLKAFPNYFSGAMDDIRIYKRALSANEVQTLYNATN